MQDESAQKLVGDQERKGCGYGEKCPCDVQTKGYTYTTNNHHLPKTQKNWFKLMDNLENANDCKQKCNTTDCTTWTWYPLRPGYWVSLECYLFSGSNGRYRKSANPDAVSGRTCIDCVWGPWSNWDNQCEAECGLKSAKKSRSRIIEVQSKLAGDPCAGKSIESEPCNFEECQLTTTSTTVTNTAPSTATTSVTESSTKTLSTTTSTPPSTSAITTTTPSTTVTSTTAAAVTTTTAVTTTMGHTTTAASTSQSPHSTTAAFGGNTARRNMTAHIILDITISSTPKTSLCQDGNPLVVAITQSMKKLMTGAVDIVVAGVLVSGKALRCEEGGRFRRLLRGSLRSRRLLIEYILHVSSTAEQNFAGSDIDIAHTFKDYDEFSVHSASAKFTLDGPKSGDTPVLYAEEIPTTSMAPNRVDWTHIWMYPFFGLLTVLTVACAVACGYCKRTHTPSHYKCTHSQTFQGSHMAKDGNRLILGDDSAVWTQQLLELSRRAYVVSKRPDLPGPIRDPTLGEAVRIGVSNFVKEKEGKENIGEAGSSDSDSGSIYEVASSIGVRPPDLSDSDSIYDFYSILGWSRSSRIDDDGCRRRYSESSSDSIYSIVED